MSEEQKSEHGAGGKPPAPVVCDPFLRPDPPFYTRKLWPHRSLSPKGFSNVLIWLAIGLAIPLIPLLGTPFGWGMLPFMAGVLIAVYLAARRSYRDAELTETLNLWPDLITVRRREPRGAILHWHANPYWVKLTLHKDARIENYITLKGNGREIELGAFLSPDERLSLYNDLNEALRHIPNH